MRACPRITRLAAGLALLVACKEPGGSPPDAGAPAEPPPAITVTAGRADLVYSYSTGGGAFATATTIDAIPEGSRRSVVVTDLSLTPDQRQAGRFVYLADLSRARPDGTYPVAIASRYGFESGLTGAGSSTVAGAKGAGVVVYTTSWCGVCRRAKALLTSLGVRFVEKDIEASRSAAEELAAKAQRAGIQPGGVPVIDVGGVLLQGLDEATLRAVLTEKGLLD